MEALTLMNFFFCNYQRIHGIHPQYLLNYFNEFIYFLFSLIIFYQLPLLMFYVLNLQRVIIHCRQKFSNLKSSFYNLWIQILRFFTFGFHDCLNCSIRHCIIVKNIHDVLCSFQTKDKPFIQYWFNFVHPEYSIVMLVEEDCVNCR